jgi:hypothetical protein
VGIGATRRSVPLSKEHPLTDRRTFLASLGVLGAAMAADPDELQAAPRATGTGAWDTSWNAGCAWMPGT